jgi:hypothetical protein
MITLEVEDYCQNCPDFEAYVAKSHAVAIGRGMNEEQTNETVITCEHRHRCENLMNQIMRRLHEQAEDR